jgi:hypothetical protein
MFLSRLRVLSFSSPRVLKTTLYVCGGGFFFVFDQKFVQTAKAQNFLPIATFFCLVRYVVYTTLSLSFRSSRRRQRRDDLFSRSSRLALLRSAQNVSSFSRGKRWKDYILFLRAKKRKLLPPLLLLLSCDLFFFITTYELYSRGLLGLLLFCSFIAFSWFKPSSRRRREESSSLVDPFSLFHSHALSFITLKKQAPSRSVDRSLLQTEDTHNLFSYIFWIK